MVTKREAEPRESGPADATLSTRPSKSPYQNGFIADPKSHTQGSLLLSIGASFIRPETVVI
jgi:hypothetical protein